MQLLLGVVANSGRSSSEGIVARREDCRVVGIVEALYQTSMCSKSQRGGEIRGGESSRVVGWNGQDGVDDVDGATSEVQVLCI